MGKRILAQRKGRGSIFKALTHRCVAPSFIPAFDRPTRAKVVDLIHNPGRGTPIAKLVTEEGKVFYLNAVEGIYIGQTINIMEADKISVGDILPLSKIPPGTVVCHIERTPGDGGKFARASGAYATIIGSSERGVDVKLPSGKTITLHPECRAVIGVISAGGRVEKPFLKAGKAYYWYKSKSGKRWPIVRGVAMNPVSHPFGGGSHQHVGKPKTVSRHAPPGKKVGSFGAKKTGKRK
ncbi:50S ribosomal protein L2 [Candidatus Geothermarchaeota archaeon]|nr:MAG: 50S ribosomal protein L2 [Candidatus Geothermarchaeota archaeon]